MKKELYTQIISNIFNHQEDYMHKLALLVFVDVSGVIYFYYAVLEYLYTQIQ